MQVEVEDVAKKHGLSIQAEGATCSTLIAIGKLWNNFDIIFEYYRHEVKTNLKRETIDCEGMCHNTNIETQSTWSLRFFVRKAKLPSK
jgi:hypothetical protein